ncbi:ATP-binding cassette sub-family B member 6, mitochondrial-like [Limulus polyphemus]|uniref:ATP-binding cassette sub-family B member 6 n=1 Tax=Limulus polyphemus TaxID=6850 RepID=A0ABM1SAD4_LIMPO|nr:ATP-binding cassette sub-family B member 6, mitochondrial-like [Limulus polyphemus]XP_022240588.1 ATP-binding cassette sub-family B member 6, mitochondrial-like [Limulus polyphemus]XP_022240589.1 ATP-binding cassette sub-family B member 6, mitochondrial-like [Limulus polyphemus]
MHFCPQNITLTEVWVNHGLSHCFVDTFGNSGLFLFISIAGTVQYFIYKKYSTPLDDRLLPKSNLLKLQIFLSFFIPLLNIVHFGLQATVVGDKQIYGHMVLAFILMSVMWPTSVLLIFLERRRALPSIPTWGHGWVLLTFWTLNFIIENLAFLNLKNEDWWFDLSSISDKFEFSLFVLRYICCMLVFVLGLKAPGIPTSQDYYLYNRIHLNQEQSEPLLEEGLTQSSQQRSTFSNLWQKSRKLAPFIWPKKSFRLQIRVIMCFTLLVLGRISNVYVPIFNKKIVNSLSLQPGETTISYRWDFVLIYIAFWFLQGQGNNSFINNIRSFLWIRVQQYTVKEIQVELYAHLHSLSLRWHLGRKTGEVLKIMDRGTSSVTSLLSYMLFNILPTVADIIIAIIYFITAFNAWFGLIMFLTMGVYLTVTIILTEWRTKFRRDMNMLENVAQAKGVDALLNFETVKYYNAEDYEVDNYRNAVENYQVEEWKSSASLSLLNTSQNMVITLGVMTGALLCAHMVVSGQGLTVGDYVLFSTYILQLYTPLNYFGTYYRLIQKAFIDMENMFDLLDEDREVKDEVNAPSLRVIKGDIEFKDVCFHYTAERPILKNISFIVPQGKTVALVGPSGSGKTTIIRLLFRFYDICSGEITIDGQNIAKVTQKSLRKHIGVVPQDTVLFNSDIRYNIRYGRVSATDEEVEAAAKGSDIHSRILDFPDGYKTVVGERGLKLSGGEKQRVAIARTLLKAPEIVLLDEATSALDTKTERHIQDSLTKVCTNKTTIIVAHRLSTIIHADEILVIREGEIIERGRHEELLKLNGSYSEMWHQQIQKRGHTSESDNSTLET